jgi:Sulfotransferase domain
MFRKNKEKIFCIGFGKTGTTTLEKTLKEFNFKAGDQIKSELLIFDWFKRDFRDIIKLCKTADAFQDVPFSLPFTFIKLDQYFKNAKFILTVRDTPEQWYNSLTKFHSKLWSEGNKIPTAQDLKNAEYRCEGYAYDSFKLLYNTSDDDLYNKVLLINAYNRHIFLVKDYFRSHPEKLLVINVSKKNDYFRLCEFLNKKPRRDNFPWENRTST